ncbi:hypothetical protein GQ54DRAFT_297497 [Martensiomyces pterosporus]|nr:hypothetical protein GQ54DRAFT_297497 [Martensiomyces pterosporus]
MPPKTNVEAKKKARDDALQFLETLDINDDEVQNDEAVDSRADAPAATGAAENAAGDEKKDPKSMLKFIDDLTESAKRSVSPTADEASASTTDSTAAPAAAPAASKASSGNWSWGGIWGQATALVEQNAQLKSGLGKLKESIEQVKNTETSKAIGSRVKTLVTQENISKLGGEFKRSLDTVIDTIAPPIQEHEVFKVRLINNIQDEGMEGVVYRTMDSVFDFHGCGEITVKSAAKDLVEAPEMKAIRGDTFTLPKGFDGGYGAAVTAIQYIQHALESNSKAQSAAAADGSNADDGEAAAAGHPESPLFYKAKKTELLVAIQPFSVIPIEDQGFLGLCIVLRDPSRNWTLRTFSQMLPLSCWAKPHDQIVDADVDVSLGTTVTTATDSAVQRKQEMNEECLYESVMLAVKSISNEYLTMRPKDAAPQQQPAAAAGSDKA